jgi:hypothetical protein
MTHCVRSMARSNICTALSMVAAVWAASIAGSASADILVCNCTGQDIIFDFTKKSDSCGDGDPWDDSGWKFLPHKQGSGDPCFTVLTGDMTGQSIHWTAAGATDSWGNESSTETWAVPNFAHDNFCMDFVSTACTTPDTCRTVGHWSVSTNSPDIEIDVDPANGFGTNRRHDCEHSEDDCVAWRCN